jgi:catechol 2,3-dioxygenase-like lactoylglutathione lyase family enzyme
MRHSAANVHNTLGVNMTTAIHHSVVIVRDLAASLRFYRDGLGLEVLQDRRVQGDWPGLFDAPSRGRTRISRRASGIALPSERDLDRLEQSRLAEGL